MLSETDKKFAEAVHIFQNLPQELRPTQEEELEFYGLYKRAVVGKCNIPKPDFFNILALAKWEAWKKLDSITMLKAREIYVEQLIKLLERFPDRPDVVELLDTFTKLHLNENDETVGPKSPEKTNTINSNNSDAISNEYAMVNEEEQPIEYTTRDVNINNDIANSINDNLMNSGLSRTDSNPPTTEEIVNMNNLNNRPTMRTRSKTDGIIYNSMPANITVAQMQQEDPSFRSDNTFIPSMNNPSLNSKITSPLYPNMNSNVNGMNSMNNINGMNGMNNMNGMNLNMGMGMGMGNLNNMNLNSPNAKIPASTSMSIVMLTRLRDLEIEVNSLNTRLNMLTTTIKNNSRNTLQNWLKFAFKTFGANVLIFLFLILILGPSGYEKIVGQLPAWLLRLQARNILGSKSNSSKAITN